MKDFKIYSVENANCLFNMLSEDMNDKQKDLFKTWFNNVVDYYVKGNCEVPEYNSGYIDFIDIVFVLITRLIKRNYDFSDFDFKESEVEFLYFYDNLQGSKFKDIEAEAVAMTTCYFMDKKYYKKNKKENEKENS